MSADDGFLAMITPCLTLIRSLKIGLSSRETPSSSTCVANISIAVDPQVLSLPPEDNITTYLQVSTPDGSKFDVIFVGTSSGQLLKAVNSLAPKSIASTRTVIIEEIEVTLASFSLVITTITIIGRWRQSC